MYRPEGFKNPYGATSITEDTQVQDILDGTLWEKNQIFEAGADAMLEGLLKTGEYEHGNCDAVCSQRGVITIRLIPEK